MVCSTKNNWMTGLGAHALAAGTIFSILSNSALAMRGHASVGAGLEYSDNIGLVEQNEEDDLTKLALLGFSLNEAGGTVAAALDGLVEYKDYQTDLYADDTYLTMRGNLDWEVLENRFNWIVGDYFSQAYESTRTPGTPANLVDTNAFTMGPDVHFRLNSVDTAEVGARWSDFYYEDNELDNSQRKLGYVRWVHDLARGGELSVNAGTEDAQFDDETADFTRNELFATYETPQARSVFGLDAGVSSIDRDAAEDIDGFLGRVRWTRELGAETLFELEAYSQYTDTGTNLLNIGETERGMDLDAEQISADIFYDKRIEAAYRKGYSGHLSAIRIFARDEDFETTDLDRTSYGGMLEADRNLMRRVRGNGYMTYRHTKYLSDDEIQKDFVLGFGVDYRITRNVTLGVDITRNSRDSTTAGNGYDENRALMTLYYGMDPYSYR